MFKSGNVTVMVANMKKVVKFYAETLGLELQHGDGHFAQIAAPGLTIGLLILPENKVPFRKNLAACP
ncbi:VOC family protein [Shouchella clausii]|uniref:hypothetical protein n=1 Tax=Shouchella clausii TaxID=79880 RepID=UPI0039832D33